MDPLQINDRGGNVSLGSQQTLNRRPPKKIKDTDKTILQFAQEGCRIFMQIILTKYTLIICFTDV